MRNVPWLFIGLLAGTIAGCNAFTGYSHGPEDTEVQLLRTGYGAGVGLAVGLFLDVALAARQRRRK
jgi:hypothetical protein